MAGVLLRALRIRRRGASCVCDALRAVMEEGWAAGIEYGDGRVRRPSWSFHVRSDAAAKSWYTQRGTLDGMIKKLTQGQLQVADDAGQRILSRNARRGAWCEELVSAFVVSRAVSTGSEE